MHVLAFNFLNKNPNLAEVASIYLLRAWATTSSAIRNAIAQSLPSLFYFDNAPIIINNQALHALCP
jgi:hypothetical protein